MIEQIKKDREDGFKGALHIDHDDNWLEGVNGAVVDGHYFSICVSSTRDADRRRLIRLPELEEAYIAAIEALKSAHGFVLISDHATSSRVLAEVEAVLANAKGATQ